MASAPLVGTVSVQSCVKFGVGDRSTWSSTPTGTVKTLAALPGRTTPNSTSPLSATVCPGVSPCSTASAQETRLQTEPLSAPTDNLTAPSEGEVDGTGASAGYWEPVYRPSCQTIQVCDTDYFGNWICRWRTFCG